MTSDLSARLANLSAAQRRLLSRRLQAARAVESEEATGSPPSAGDASSSPGRSDGPNPVLEDAEKRAVQALGNSINDQLNGSIYADHALFLNFGYAAPHSAEQAPEGVPNATSVRLVIELIGSCNLTGWDVLDVGCGRGGTLAVVQERFRPARLVGVDLSSSAIAFCRRRHRATTMDFLVGDAEDLPFPAASFDVVLNVESSHGYPDAARFYGEVCRVLRPGGDFLYTDIFPVEAYPARLAALRAAGLAIDAERDITAGVMQSCEQSAGRRLKAFGDFADRDVASNLVGTETSRSYRGMRDGTLTYRLLRMHKPAS